MIVKVEKSWCGFNETNQSHTEISLETRHNENPTMFVLLCKTKKQPQTYKSNTKIQATRNKETLIAQVK